MTPKEVCIALGFCLPIAVLPKVVEIVPLNSDSKPCRLCQIVVAKVEEKLNNQTAQQNVENCVKHVCLDLPKKLRPKCRQFIDEYATEIIKHFPTSSPKKLCTDACICKPNEPEKEDSSEEGLSDRIAFSYQRFTLYFLFSFHSFRCRWTIISRMCFVRKFGAHS